MKRIVIILSVYLLFTGIIPLEAADGRRSEAQRFQIGAYKKAIISGDLLYMNDAQDVVESHSGRLILVPLTENATPQTWLSLLGVDGTEWSALKQQSVALYPFCWDIVGQYFIAINVEELGIKRTLRFALISIPLQDVPGLTQLDIFPEEYGRSDLFPLADLFSPLPIKQRDSVFFDIVPFDQQMFHLYTTYEGVMTVWDYDPEIHEILLTTDWSMHPSHLEPLLTRQKSWSQISTFPIDFEGPFRVIQLQEKTYIFSEHVRTIYLLEGERLTPLITLPPLPEGESAGPLDNVFVVDKDHHQAVFFVPSQQHPETPGVITIGDTSALPQGAESALRSALKLYHESKE